MAYLDGNKLYENKFSIDLIHFYVIWQLMCMVMFVLQEAGNVSDQ